MTREQKKSAASTFDLYETLHKSEQRHLGPGMQPDHRYEVTLEPDDYTDEKYRLFENYQQTVHKERPDEISKGGFKRFLCSSPIQRHNSPSGISYGSFHQCYRLDGRLFAMGVIDLLPHAVSGVYFIYHSDFERYSFGKLSALRETALAGEIGYDYYYMGYYIHDCKKMRYKATYRPQYVLDFQSHTWDPLDDQMESLMSQKKFVSMSVERQRASEETYTEDKQQTSRTAVDTASVTSQQLFQELSADFHCEPCTAQEAERSGKSLLAIGMPGVMTRDQVASSVNLGEVKVLLGRSDLHCLSELMAWDAELDTWETDAETQATSLKGMAAELAACIGPELLAEIAIDFTR